MVWNILTYRSLILTLKKGWIMLRNQNKKVRYVIAGRHEIEKYDPWKWGNKKPLISPFFRLLERYCMIVQQGPYTVQQP